MSQYPKKLTEVVCKFIPEFLRSQFIPEFLGKYRLDSIHNIKTNH